MTTVQAGPLLVRVVEAKDGELLLLLSAWRGGQPVATFTLHGRHLQRHPEAVDLIRDFLQKVEVVRTFVPKEGGDGAA